MRAVQLTATAEHERDIPTLRANVIAVVTRNPDSVDRYIFRFHYIRKEMSLSDSRHCIFLPWHLIGKVQPRQYECALCFHVVGTAA